MSHTLDQVVLEIEQKIINTVTKRDRAECIYDWVQNHIAYDDARRERIVRGFDQGEPLRPEETLLRGKGVCSDKAVLYTAIGRKLRLTVHYATVDIGEKLLHAINIVETESGNIQVDATNGKFCANYPNYRIKDPLALQDPPPPQFFPSRIPYHPPPRRCSWWKPALIAAGVGAAVALGVYLIPPMFKQRNVKYLETSRSVRFITKHGDLKFTLVPDARNIVKEALFYTEAMQGDSSDNELLAPYVMADLDGDNHFTREEAIDARDRAKAEYLRSLD